MKSLIQTSLENSHTYADYRKIVSDLLAKGKASGIDQSDDYTHYTLLNETRMNRLEKTIQVDTEVASALHSLPEKYTWLVLSEGWCGDAAQIVPVLHKMAESSDNIDLRIVFRDKNPELMDAFLTRGARSIPKVIILDPDLNVVADWGPRPQEAADLIINYKAAHGVVDEEAKTQLQLWYLHDKGLSTQREITELMTQLAN